MNSTKGEVYDLCCEGHSKKTLLFGIALLIIGLMMQNKMSIPDIIVVIGAIVVLKGVLEMATKKD